MRNGQKGALEQAHTMLRMVLPKHHDITKSIQKRINIRAEIDDLGPGSHFIFFYLNSILFYASSTYGSIMHVP